jgi:hypothetical protein
MVVMGLAERFELIRRIGREGKGSVYEAPDDAGVPDAP